ncbi:MAG TPA: UTP--glucose-1-phosphate uridylyltransferase GalU [Euzebyales bacterium]
MALRARKAVIPAAGLGTRFLPATKSQPKEMLPLVDKPAVQYTVEEAVTAGIDDLLVVTGRGTRSLEDHFDRDEQLEASLAADGRDDLLAAIRQPAMLARLHYVRQGRPLGLGHAVGCARNHVGDEPFAVLLGDDVLGDGGQLLRRMTELNSVTERTVLAVTEFDDDQLHKYGVIAGEPDPSDPDVYHVTDMVEKPGPTSAPSNLCIIGRYVLTPDIFDQIDALHPGQGGEIQLTDAMRAQALEKPIRAIRYTGPRFDLGSKADWLRATVRLATERADLGPEFRAFLREVVQSW